MDWRARTEIVVGRAALERLARARVMVWGVGGVGSPAAEMLCRLGVGRMTLIDGDVVAESNLNRQLQALRSTIGQSKAELLAERFREINPEGDFVAVHRFVEPEGVGELLAEECPDCVVDAIDSLPTKCRLIEECVARGLPLISSMGAGFRTDPGRVKVATLNRTEVCPLAKKLRRMLRERGIDGSAVRVVYSDEMPQRPAGQTEIGSVGFVTGTFGMYAAREVYRQLVEK